MIFFYFICVKTYDTYMYIVTTDERGLLSVLNAGEGNNTNH